MKIFNYYREISIKIEKLRDIPPLLFRLILAYGFYMPAMMKWKNIGGIIEWFDGMGIPFPGLNAYLAAGTELAAVVLLPLGLATRFISIPLMITMIVAILTVHIGNGFSAGDNGFEIPLYYFLMVLSLLVSGPGKLSIDFLIARKQEGKN